MAVKEVIKDALVSAYSGTMRRIATEAATTALSNAACFKDFQLVEIPEVMETKLNASTGAALMRRWFSAPTHTMSKAMNTGTVDFRTVPSAHVDKSIVKMSWVKSFRRVQSALMMLEAHRINTPAAARELKRVLSRAQLLNKRCSAIGTSSDVVTLHETAHLNYVKVNLADSTAPLDCALGSFSLHMAVSGTVEPSAIKIANITHQVAITHLHFYVRDNYEFSADDEPLGHWGRDGASRLPSPGKAFVENQSFREWRTRHGRGGDFVVFSDVMTKQLSLPIRLFI